MTATYLSETPVIHVLPSPVTFSKVLCPRSLCHSERRFTQYERGRSQRGTSFHTRLRSSRFIGAGPGKAVSARVTGSRPRLPQLQRTWSIFALCRLVTRWLTFEVMMRHQIRPYHAILIIRGAWRSLIDKLTRSIPDACPLPRWTLNERHAARYKARRVELIGQVYPSLIE